MGGAVSTGYDNDELVDNLVEADYIKSDRVERIFRMVDRADYFLPEHRDSAYKDLAWKHGHLHLSAPCIYSEVLESLQLEEGMSFLNLGSGTGYLSTMAGLMLGSYGINHGVEVYEDVVEYARAKLDEFKLKSSAFEEFDFAEPQFVIGNCLQLSSASRLYDRVYCGAACPPEHENYMRNLIKVDGILVMPLNDQLLQVRRISETEWTSKSVLPVSFATLVVPIKDKNDLIELPDCHLLTLQDICRHNIRSIIRKKILEQFPKIARPIRTPRPPKLQTNQTAGRHSRLVNLIPMQMGMMYLGNVDISNDGIDEEDETPHHRRHRLDDSFECSDSDCSFYGDLNQHQSSLEQVNHHDNGLEEQEEGELKFPAANNNHHEKVSYQTTVAGCHPEVAGQEDIVCGVSQQILDNNCRPSTSSGSANADNKRSSPDSRLSESEAEDSNSASKRMRCSDSEEEEGDSEEEEESETECGEKATEGSGDAITQQKEDRQDPSLEEVSAALTNSAPILISLRCSGRMRRRDRSSDDSDLEHMELDHGSAEFGSEAERLSGDVALPRPVNPTAVLKEFNLLSLPRKLRCSSSTSADTADTSGFGSFGDESLDLPALIGSSPASESRNGGGNGCPGNKQTGPITKESIEEEDASSGGGAEGPVLGQLLKKYIQMLPLPLALRSYLAYYRK